MSELSAQLDENGLIRHEGRLIFAEYVPYGVRVPVILPRGHPVTKWIAK